MKFTHFVACSVLVHVILFASIFEIYFTSPLVHGVTPFRVDARLRPPARRLVLFVADGLRADKFFERTQSHSLFLRDIIQHVGTWGISHTHIPTESRPGHVALIAGFYEDVSAIARGWKENPVEFDSVFNQSRETWSWGSPDILPMFAKGSTGSHMHTHCYESDVESFAGDDSSKLDTWVFKRVEEFFDNAKRNAVLLQKLNQDKIVFFLHLLGLDSNGHSHKPWSREYLTNIEVVDELIRKTVLLFDEFYNNDNETAYVFTSDHGMTDWGSHGSGHPSETLTPLVAWGAGVASKSGRGHSLFTKNFTDAERELTSSWGLNPDERHDVEQADVSALLSALVGIPYPLNSVGLLPVDYLSATFERKAIMARTNARQIAEQFLVKMENVREHAITAFFRPFSPLLASEVTRRDNEIGDMIVDRQFEASILKSKELVELALMGLRYYHTYDRVFLHAAVMLSFVGWIFVTSLLGMKQVSIIVSQAKKLSPARKVTIYGVNATDAAFVIGAVIINAVLVNIRSPWTHYVYCMIPLPIWHSIASDWYFIKAAAIHLHGNSETRRTVLIFAVTGIAGIWLMIGSFFYRNLLCIGLLGLGVLPWCIGRTNGSVSKIWLTSSLCLSVFPLLPVVGRNPDMRLVMAGGIFASIMCLLMAVNARIMPCCKWTGFIPYVFPVVAACITCVTSDQSGTQGTVSNLIHGMSWTILVLSWVSPLFSKTSFYERLIALYVWQSSAYMLLSLSYDALFCVALCVQMHTWIHMEYNLLLDEKPNQKVIPNLRELDFRRSQLTLGDEFTFRDPNFSDVRRSFMLVFFLVVAFFGVGNIASINSFDVRVVLPFLTVFDPFIMGGLLAYKVLLPYLMVTCSCCGIALCTGLPLRTLCCIVMVISDVMAMHFVFMVKDHGSWLDIGTSISHFVIVMSMITSLLLFFLIANFLTTYVITTPLSRTSKR